MKLLDDNGKAKELVNGKYPAKVLHITHSDGDAVGCMLSVENTFADVDHENTTYGKPMTNYLNNLMKAPTKVCKYDLVIVTDLSMPVEDFKILMKVLQIADYRGEFVFLDHHNTSKPLHSPENNIYVVEGICAAKITKEYLESVFGVDLSFLNDTIKYVNDYDLWIHKYKESKKLQYLLDYEQELHWKKAYKKFIEKYPAGVDFNNLTKEQTDIITYKEVLIEQAWDDLELIPYEGTKIGLMMVEGKFINEMCDRVLKCKEIDIEVIINFDPKRNKGSIRGVANSVPEINIGKLLKMISDSTKIKGGGHELAAGYSITGIDDSFDKEDKLHFAKKEIDTLVTYLTTAFPALKN
jgi:nanoRNase/pAp phosphatase (c-di-AMP/oligoRNAs hydrolase)